MRKAKSSSPQTLCDNDRKSNTPRGLTAICGKVTNNIYSITIMKPSITHLACGISLGISLSLGSISAIAAPPAQPAALSAEGQQLQAQYEAMLAGLQAGLSKALPAVDEARKTALQQARAAVAKVTTEARAAKDALGKVATAKALVDHANGKWLGGAAKGIAAAEAALKKATTDAEREAANKELAKWQADREAGLKALAERQAALESAKLEEPKLAAVNQAAEDALAKAQAAELDAATVALKDVESFLSSDKLDAKLVLCAVLVNATPKGLAEFATQDAEQAALVTKLLADEALMKAMVTAGGAKGGKYGQAAQIYAAIQKASPKAKDGLFQRLALAVSLEHAVPIAQTNPEAATNVPATVDPVKRYQHFERASLAGELDPAFKTLTAWELRNVVNGDESEETLSWGREMLRNYRPDHVLNPDYGWRYSRAVTTDVRYGSQNVKDDLPTLHKYQNIIKNGGVCGRRAFFGRFILRSFGIPTTARPQRGHAALAHWTPDGWVINLGAGWGSPDASGVMELSDADFVLETKVRKLPAQHAKSLRAQWAGDALGEAKYVSLKPGTGGFWNVLAVFAKKAAVAGENPATPAALGENLGEVNESAEVRARALVKATVTDADKKITIASSGTITIPAAACGGAQILGSFDGGHQLFSGGGTITCDVEIPSAGKYTLNAKVATVQDNPKMQLVAGNASPIEITVPYTIGQWEPTPAAEVTLTQGKNTLRFNRPEGSRGLSIKEFTLTPVQ